MVQAGRSAPGTGPRALLPSAPGPDLSHFNFTPPSASTGGRVQGLTALPGYRKEVPKLGPGRILRICSFQGLLWAGVASALLPLHTVGQGPTPRKPREQGRAGVLLQGAS